MNKDFIQALEEIEREKGISKEIIFDALEKALVKAYEKNYDDQLNVQVMIDRDTGKVTVSALKKVVEEVQDPILEISLDEARAYFKKAEIGEEIPVPVIPKNFGRIAAQTARNIVVQKIKDAEREVIYDEYKDREREMITGSVQRIDHGILCVDLGRIEGIVPQGEQIPGEHYEIGKRLKLFVKEVKNTTKGPQVILSRADKDLVTRLLELEVPEIHDGVVEIYSIAREVGSRTKLAVFTNDPSIDPVGACVGYKGQRVKTIVDELNGEKLDIIIYDKDIVTFLSNALSPAEVVHVFTDMRAKSCRILVAEDQLSLAIGKEGQNVRLAAKLTNWKIDIKGADRYIQEIESGELEMEFEGEAAYLESRGVTVTDEMMAAYNERKKTPLERFEEENAEDVIDPALPIETPESDSEDGTSADDVELLSEQGPDADENTDLEEETEGAE